MLKLQRLLRIIAYCVLPLLPVIGFSEESSQADQEFWANNEFVQSDVDAFLLKGPLKKLEMAQFTIPIEELHDYEDRDLQIYSDYSIEALFDTLGFSDNLVVQMYEDREILLSVYRRAEPYQNNERRITSIMLYGDAATDKSAFYSAVLNREFTLVHQSWEKNRSTTRVNLNMEKNRDLSQEQAQSVIVEYFDEQHRPMDIYREEGNFSSQDQYLYLSYDAYKVLDLKDVEATIIEVATNLSDIINLTIEDFKNLDPRVTLIVSEDIDYIGNATIEKHYNFKKMIKKVFQFTYY